jgi:hypothetical protein
VCRLKNILLSALIGLLVLTGCATAPPSAPEPVVSAPSVVVGPVLEPIDPEYIPEPPRVAVQEPRVVESNQNPALDALVDQALRFLSEREYARAVSTAERAMSIDRYDPRVYLLLAQAHKFSGNLALSRQYAERGLAVSQPDTDTSRALENLK